MSKIRAIAMDVDGTLTDGGIYVSEDGEIMKRFYVRDGYAIKHFLPKMGIIPIVITGRESKIVSRRCDELGIRYFIQGSTDKWCDLKTILNKLGISAEETAYIGDDINDIDCMSRVAIKGCPADATKEVSAISDYVANASGGAGAVREFIEWLGEINEKDLGFKWNDQ